MRVVRVRQQQEFTRRANVLLPGHHIDVVDGRSGSGPLWCRATLLKPSPQTSWTFSAFAKESLDKEAVRRRVDARGRSGEVRRMLVSLGHDRGLVVQAEHRHVSNGRGEREGHGFLQLNLGDYQVRTMDGGSQASENARTLDQHRDDHRGEDVGIDVTDVVVAPRERPTLDPRQPAPNLLQLRHQATPVLNITS